VTAGRTAGLLGALVGGILFFFVLAAPAGAVTFGVDWNGDNGPANLDAAQQSGARVYHAPLAYGDWVGDDALVTAAWERGLTILPTITRASPVGSRFLLPTDPEWVTWGTWVQQLAERYGPGGSFWVGRPNPTPITAWEVWNEPNLPENDPLLGVAECAAIGQPFKPMAGTCVQPQSYGAFLAYTAEHLQAGSLAVSGLPTNVLSGGLNLEFGEGFAPFLSKAVPYGALSPNVTGVALHPYALDSGLVGLIRGIEGARRYLDRTLGAEAKTLWITEFGWPVSGTEGFPLGGGPVTEAEQAELLSASLGWIAGAAAADKIEAATWYSLRDFSSSRWDGYAGLLREDGTPRPAWYAFRQALGVEAPAPAPELSGQQPVGAL
jgi:hypothetical protein